MVRASGLVSPVSGRPIPVASAYVDPEAAARSTPRSGWGPVVDVPASALTRTRPPRAALSTSNRVRLGRFRAATLSPMVSSTGARPSATTVETVTPTARTAPKYSAW